MCSSDAAQFTIGFTATTNGTLLHKATGLCVTIGAPPCQFPPAPPPVTPTGTHPCDIYASGNTPCVAAHSMMRAMYASYDGPLYQVVRKSDNLSIDIKTVSPGGPADAAAQDAFCADNSCFVEQFYDQSPYKNHIAKYRHDRAVNASALPITINGHKVYGAYCDPPCGYRILNTTGVARGADPESMYAIFGGRKFNSRCCFDYGNAESDGRDDG